MTPDEMTDEAATLIRRSLLATARSERAGLASLDAIRTALTVEPLLADYAFSITFALAYKATQRLADTTGTPLAELLDEFLA